MNNHFDFENLDIKKLVADRERFSNLVYSSLAEAKDEIGKRWEDRTLEDRIAGFLNNDLPKPFKNGNRAVLFRPLFSPNYEFLRFMKIADIHGFEPLFLEYHDDKFTSLNPIKHCLGKIKFRQADGKYAPRIKNENIIDFNESQGKKIKDVKTIWSQSLISFHHELLESAIPNCSKYLFDASDWFHRMGGRARNYYLKYISLFVRNSVCFENFIPEDDELRFVAEIFLPSFFEIWRLTGKKPIFVELLPRGTQNDSFWMSYPVQTVECIKRRIMV